MRSTEPPGIHVYTSNGYSLYEIDGEKNKLYAQNLCLFAKLFLDTKSVFYDVTTFLYYLLVAHNPTPRIPSTQLDVDAPLVQNQVVGFFSKEKMSWDNNNLACILVFPPWQKQGLGQILMGASYEMSKREGRMGGPEKREYATTKIFASANILQHCQTSVPWRTCTTGRKRLRVRCYPVPQRRP